MDRYCDRGEPGSGFPRDCDNCIENRSPCDSSLAYLNICRPHSMLPNSRLRRFLAAQADQRRVRLSWQERAMAEQPSTQSYADFPMHSKLPKRYRRSPLFMSWLPPVSVGLMPSVPQQPITATLPQHDTPQSYDAETSGSAVLNEHGVFEDHQATIDAGQGKA